MEKKTTKSKCGYFLSVCFLLTFVILFYFVYLDSKKNPSVKYSQDFIRKRLLDGKKVTLGFNVSDEWKNDVIFTLYDSQNEQINFTTCNENLEESENFTYYCIVNYSITSHLSSSHILKLHLNLIKKLDKEEKIPFSISIREPIVKHTKYKNPLDIYDKDSINRFISFFQTNEVTSYRRYLKFINYITYGGCIHDDKKDEAIYLDDYEDSRKTKTKEEKNFLGSYRILLSKKIEIYEKKFNGKMNIISRVGGYYSFVFFCYSILIFIFVAPNDNIRIYESLKEKKDLTELIYNDYVNKNEEYIKKILKVLISLKIK